MSDRGYILPKTLILTAILSFLTITAAPAADSPPGDSATPLVEQKEEPPEKFTLGVVGGMGFAGIRVAEQVELPELSCTDDVCVEDTTSVFLRKNRRYTWRTAPTFGIVGKFNFIQDRSIGLGIGLQMAFLTEGDDTVVYPAVTFHFGSERVQVYGGFLLAPADDVRFPNGKDEVTIRVDGGPTPTFVTTKTDATTQLFIGFTVGGKSLVGGPDE